MPQLEALPLLAHRPESTAPESPASETLSDLTHIAFLTDSLSERSMALYEFLRKLLGHNVLCKYMFGIQVLAQRGESAGARLLAALLDVNTPGEWLVPRIHNFTHTRRLQRRISRHGPTNAVLGHWENRFNRLWSLCQQRLAQVSDSELAGPDCAAQDLPIVIFRRCLRQLIAGCYRHEDVGAQDRTLLVDLAQLEVDAYQDRVSQLAGRVNPYRVSSVSKVLPRLSRADAEIRDLREFIGWVEADRITKAFHESRPRLLDVMEGQEKDIFLQALNKVPDLGPLVDALKRLLRKPCPVSQLAGHVACVMALTHRLCGLGVRREGMDLITAVRLVQDYGVGDEVHIPIDARLQQSIGEILSLPPFRGGLPDWLPDNLRLADGLLIINVLHTSPGESYWQDSLPSAAMLAAVTEEPALAALQTADFKRLVLRNLDNVNITRGFLRNPRIVSIPGLVLEIAQRCRSATILSEIANDRNLHSGFVHKGVPEALLKNPCRIPVGSLRKFIHVRYFSKVELQSMVRDKAGIRDEVVKEIRAYLKGLAR